MHESFSKKFQWFTAHSISILPQLVSMNISVIRIRSDTLAPFSIIGELDYSLRGDSYFLSLLCFNLQWKKKFFCYVVTQRWNKLPPKIRQAMNITDL